VASRGGIETQDPDRDSAAYPQRGKGTMNSFFALKTRQASMVTHGGERTTPEKPRVDARHGAGKHLAAHDLVKSYRKGRHLVPVLLGVDLEVRPREFVAVVGQSGSGKSTLLHLLGTLDAPDGGEISFDGRRIDNLPVAERDRLRNRSFGMIFQFYHLLPELTTIENVLVPLMIAEGAISYWRNKRQHFERARRLLETVGLQHRLSHKPHELSGGEMQRAAIARALIARPRVLLADEPTGNLDRQNGQEILRILRTLNRRENVTIVMVTHDTGLAEQADRIVRLAEGRVSNDGKVRSPAAG
jgi:lipoprotein-releasing system ATP-binding protein